MDGFKFCFSENKDEIMHLLHYNRSKNVRLNCKCALGLDICVVDILLPAIEYNYDNKRRNTNAWKGSLGKN